MRRTILDLTRRYEHLRLPSGELAEKMKLAPLKREVERLIGPLPAEDGKDKVLEAYRSKVFELVLDMRQHRVSGILRAPSEVKAPMGQNEVRAAIEHLDHQARNTKRAA
jgi:hypothetical protein